MRIGEIIGTVTLNRSHPLLTGARFKLVVPKSLDDLLGKGGEPAEEFTLYDDLGAGIGSMVAISESREAAMPFHPEMKPIDAYCSAILDTITVRDIKETGERQP